MQQKRRIWKRAVVVAALLAMAFMAALYAASGDSSCEKALAWLEEEQSLPASWQQVSALPLSYRRAVFSSLSPSQKSDLRRQRLDAQLTLNPQWTSQQRQVVRQGRMLFTPEFFSHDPQSPAWDSAVAEPFEAFRKAALQAFDQRRFQRLFLGLGTASDAEYEDDADLLPCNCNTALDANCVTTNCSPKATGCGPDGTSRCNGLYSAFPDPTWEPFTSSPWRSRSLR